KELDPGEETFVSLDWNTGRSLVYSHSATIFTNDAARRSIQFTVTGKVLLLIGADVEQISLPPAESGSKREVELLLHSQIWKDFEVVSADLPVEDFVWRVEDVDPKAVPSLDAEGVRKLHMEFHTPQARDFQHTLQLKVAQADVAGEPESLSIPISGSVLRPLSFYGPDIDSEGTIDLGNIPEGESRRAKLIAKVRDEIRTLDNAKVEISPDFVRATFEPYPSGQPGIYQLSVEVPAGQPPCQYKSNPTGRLTIHTEHPRIGDVELLVTFAIVPRS
ncbi:MAG TPA: hypothetical protein VFV87_08830, partial [Pirellulaceae bacterium]|nr:hypothetical protein [Pirellulaceae bacterium]